MSSYKILILGASYGSLLASKILFGDHSITLVCLPAEAALINTEGFRVRMPVKGREELIEIDSRRLRGKVTAVGASAVNPAEFDLIVLAMQEPQYGSSGVRELLRKIAQSRVPCMSIMNMPPLPYMHRVPNLDPELLRPAFTSPEIWDDFDPATLTLCSPDPQAVRLPDDKVNVLQVTLPTNFKVARFECERSNDILRQLGREIDEIRFEAQGIRLELPVKLRFFDSVFVPLAKWAMLMAGNYRCITEDGIRTAREAVHHDIEESRSIYDFVVDLCVQLGATKDELVSFEKYAAAAQGLSRPASAARALDNGAVNIERVDRLVQLAATQKGLRHPVLDAIVKRVDRRLELNRRAARTAA